MYVFLSFYFLYTSVYIYFFIYLAIAFLLCFLICFVTAPLNRVTWGHGAIKMLLLLLLLFKYLDHVDCVAHHGSSLSFCHSGTYLVYIHTTACWVVYANINDICESTMKFTLFAQAIIF